MNICGHIPIVFADKLHLVITFWIFTVLRQNLLLNWMVRNIMKPAARIMMQKELRI